MNIVRGKFKSHYLLFIVFILSSCSYMQEFSIPEVTTLFSPDHNNIKTVAILPFKNLTDNEELPENLRKALFGNLILKNYDVVKLNQTDHALKMASYHTTDAEQIEYSKLADILNADALIYGTVTKCKKLFGVVYSRVDIGAELEMVDSSNSKVIWKVNHVESTHSGTPPLSPFSIPEKIIDSTVNVRDEVIVDTTVKLAKKFLESIPDCNIKNVLQPFNVVTKTVRDSKSEIVGDFNVVDADIVDVDSIDAEIMDLKVEDERPKEFSINIKGVNDSKVVHYKVKPKDTLYKISKKFYGQGTNWKNIQTANNEIESSALKIGYDLVLPDIPVLTDIDEASLLNKDHFKKAVYQVKSGDSLNDIASVLYQDRNKWEIIYEHNKDELEESKDLVVGQVIIIPLTY